MQFQGGEAPAHYSLLAQLVGEAHTEYRILEEWMCVRATPAHTRATPSMRMCVRVGFAH